MDVLANVDLTPYQNAPQLTAEATVTLAVDLGMAKPADAPPQVEKAAKRMLSSVATAKLVMAGKIEEAGLESGVEVAFDFVMDRFWGAMRRRCEYCMTFAHDGLDYLTDAEQVQLDLEAKRQRAEDARELDKHMFGAEGLTFLNRPFNEQVVLMASRLEFIQNSSKFEQFKQVMTTELYDTLVLLQGRYEAMVHERSTRDDTTEGLKKVRAELQRNIGLYASAVLSMLDDEDPSSVQVVLDALRPMVNARIGRSRSESAQVATPVPVPVEPPADQDQPDQDQP